MLNEPTISPDVSVDRSIEKESVFNWQLPLLLVLLVLFVSVIFVAIKTIEYRHVSRTSFIQLQMLEKERDRLLAQWSRLRLEQGTVLDQIYVEKQARQRLGMKMPEMSEIRRLSEVQVVVESTVKESVRPSLKVSLSD